MRWILFLIILLFSLNVLAIPQARDGSFMVYDNLDDVIIMFGGINNSGSCDGSANNGFYTFCNGTWIYDFKTNAWTLRGPDKVPQGRDCTDMAYDSKNNVTVIFGGYNDGGSCDGSRGGYCNGTWIYSYENNSWTMRDPVKAPGARYDSAMAYDSADDVIIMFGGTGGYQNCDGAREGSYCNGTWIYSYKNNSWTLRGPDKSPSARYRLSMAYDSADDVIIMFGGFGNDGNCDGSGGNECNGTWIYSYKNNSWTLRGPDKSPSARRLVSMAYDNANNVTVMFGGYNSSAGCDGSGGTSCNGTWIYSYKNNSWTLRGPDKVPGARNTAAFAYDSTNHGIVLFGGSGPGNCDGSGGVYCNGTWIYSYANNSWTLRSANTHNYLYRSFLYGWNMISIPLEPVNKEPEVVFKNVPLSGNLHRYDHIQQSYITYYDFKSIEFGNITVGESYWFSCLNPVGCNLQYDAYENTGDMKINLPTKGWYFIGGASKDISFENLLVSNGDQTRPFSEVANVWIQDPFIGYNNSVDGYFNAGILPTDQDHYLRSWNGYWVNTFFDNLELVIPNSLEAVQIKIVQATTTQTTTEMQEEPDTKQNTKTKKKR